MHPSLTIIDDLLPHGVALSVRESAIEAGFETIQYMGGTYQGTGLKYNPDCIKQKIEEVFGRSLEFDKTAFRLGHKDTQLHVNIHADNVVSEWAGVYYLNLPQDCYGGTAFYTLKDTGWDTMPTQQQLDEKGLTLDWLRDKWTKEEAWNLNTVAGMKFNRLIFYPTRYFHSRFPLTGWGEEAKPCHARLVWVGFWKG